MTMDEYDPIAEVGLSHDKQLICTFTGFLQYNNSSRDLCQRYIPKGDKFYDLISRYDDVVAFVLNRSDGRSGNISKFIIPFLKAYGITDFAAMKYCGETMRIMPEAKKVMKHLRETLPVFFTTTTYEHNVLNICEALDFPRATVDCSEISFDDYDDGNMRREDAKQLREISNKITNLKMPTQKYELNVPVKIPPDEIAMIEVLDEVFELIMKRVPFAESNKNAVTVGANEKAYFLLELRKKTQIEFEGTAMIGGDITDIHALDTIKGKGGLAMSFNGCDFAVRESNIAVISRDCTPAAVLVQEFYNEGIEAVFDLVGDWNRETLKKKDFPDPYLMKTMLESNPKKLPEVYIVTKDNVDEIAKKSDAYRKKLLR
jgi:predicted HAD superfamily phosphohydrolase